MKKCKKCGYGHNHANNRQCQRCKNSLNPSTVAAAGSLRIAVRGK